MLARLNPMFFDPDVDPIVTAKTPPPGKDILTASANNLYSNVSLADLKGLHREVRPELAAGEAAERQAGRGGLPRRRPLLEGDHRGRPAPRGRDSVRLGADGQRAAGAGPVLPHRREGRPREVRHRLGERQGVRRGHDQRLHRGVPRRARRQGRLGRPGVLRQPREDRAHPQVRRQRAVVRGPHAVRREVPQADGEGHRGQRHRRRGGDRRLGPGDAHRHQPAQRSGDPRAARQQVGVAEQRPRGQRQRHAGHDAQRVLVDARGSRAQQEVRHAVGASSSPTCTR